MSIGVRQSNSKTKQKIKNFLLENVEWSADQEIDGSKSDLIGHFLVFDLLKVEFGQHVQPVAHLDDEEEFGKEGEAQVRVAGPEEAYRLKVAFLFVINKI